MSMKRCMVGVVSLLFLASCGSTQEAVQSAASAPQVVSSAPIASSSFAQQATQEEGAARTLLKTATLLGTAHDVAGTVNVYDDGVLEIEGFSYDGTAPDVYVAFGSLSEEGAFQYEVLATPLIEGAYSNETLALTMESGVDAAAYSAVSIWCHDFEEDFGSAPLQ